MVRRLARGVRSSCDASATSWRCDSTDRCSASRVVLKEPASRPSSSSPSPSRRRRGSSAPGDGHGALREARHGAQRPSRDDPSQQGPHRHACAAHAEEHRAQAVQQGVNLPQRAGHLDRGAGAEGRREHPQMAAGDLLVGEVGAALAARHLRARASGSSSIPPWSGWVSEPSAATYWTYTVGSSSRGGRPNSRRGPGPKPPTPPGTALATWVRRDASTSARRRAWTAR